MRTATLACLTAAATIVVACASPDPGAASRDSAAARARIETIVASADRSDADRKNDVRRKPVELLAFTGVRPGMTVLDVSSGGGYTTELLARAVAPGGRVYAQTPRPPSPTLAARLQKPVAADVTSVVRPFESAPPPEAAGTLDLVLRGAAGAAELDDRQLDVFFDDAAAHCAGDRSLVHGTHL